MSGVLPANRFGSRCLERILKKGAQVVLLGSEFDDLAAAELIPLLKQCNREVTIILVSNDESQPAIADST